MQTADRKCVMVIDEALPLGIIANTAAILGTTLGNKQPDIVGADVVDKTGNEHLGIVEIPVPILKGNVRLIKEIRERLYESEFKELLTIDFSDVAQGCKTYDDFSKVNSNCKYCFIGITDEENSLFLPQNTVDTLSDLFGFFHFIFERKIPLIERFLLGGMAAVRRIF